MRWLFIIALLVCPAIVGLRSVRAEDAASTDQPNAVSFELDIQPI